jgi:nucleoside-diphosphate-sugar epimerase
MSDRAILVTGGTGLIGDATVRALGGTSAISLSRHGAGGWQAGGPVDRRSISTLLPQRGGHVVAGSEARDAVHIAGNVTQPRLGLSQSAYDELAERVAVVIHCAGVSDFTTPRRVTQALNVEGTRHAVAFAERAGAALYHVSTGYIRTHGTTVRGRWGAEVYLDSKRRAEDVALACETLAAIVRPSIVFGHSLDGSSPSFQGLHRLIGTMLENRVPLLPFAPRTRVDFLPRDLVGRVIARLARQSFTGEYWLTAGEDAPTFGRVVEILVEFGRELGIEVHPPRFVTQDMIDRLIKPAGGEAVARRVEVLLALTSHMTEEPLPCSRGSADAVDPERALRQGAAYWGERQGAASWGEHQGVGAHSEQSAGSPDLRSGENTHTPKKTAQTTTEVPL